MSKLIPLVLVAVMLSGSGAMARNMYDEGWTDMSLRYGGFDPNSQEGARAFWDYINRQGN